MKHLFYVLRFEICRFLWKLKVLCPVFGTCESRIYPVTPYVLKIHFNIIFQLTRRSPKSCLSSVAFASCNCVSFPLSRACYTLRPPLLCVSFSELVVLLYYMQWLWVYLKPAVWTGWWRFASCEVLTVVLMWRHVQWYNEFECSVN